jgi:6-phosphogluconolactonase
MDMNARVFPDLDALSRGILDELLRVVRESISQRGRFAIALSGGKTPAELYKLWAADSGATDWQNVHLFWGDERYVRQTDELSNFRMTLETGLLEKVPAANVYPMRGPEFFASPEAAAEGYEAELRKFFGDGAPAFDLQLFGLGVEGHVASLFPGSPALAETERWVLPVVAPAKPPQRLTLTPVVLNRGRHTFFLVAGANKREIVTALRAEPAGKPSQFPAGQVHPEGRSVWFLDKAADG